MDISHARSSTKVAGQLLRQELTSTTQPILTMLVQPWLTGSTSSMTQEAAQGGLTAGKLAFRLVLGDVVLEVHGPLVKP